MLNQWLAVSSTETRTFDTIENYFGEYHLVSQYIKEDEAILIYEGLKKVGEETTENFIAINKKTYKESLSLDSLKETSLDNSKWEIIPTKLDEKYIWLERATKDAEHEALKKLYSFVSVEKEIEMPPRRIPFLALLLQPLLTVALKKGLEKGFTDADQLCPYVLGMLASKLEFDSFELILKESTFLKERE